MESALREIRHYTVRGHHLRVFPAGPNQWAVTVDGSTIGRRFPSSHGAWAAGVAESYRQDPCAEPRNLAALASRAAARQHADVLRARPRR
jgi:hypothetical protein